MKVYYIIKYIRLNMQLTDNKVEKRLRYIIRYIDKHPECSTEQLAEKFKVSKRAIQIDLRFLRENWKEGKLTSSGGVHCVKINKNIADKYLELQKKTFIKLALEAMEDLSDLSRHHENIEKELNLENLNTPYYIKAEVYEELNTNKLEIKDLQDAIVEDYIIDFHYRDTYYHVEPYRLVNFDGVWYLYGKDIEEKEENNHKTWLLQDIGKVEVYYGQTHEKSDEQIEEELDNADDASFVPDHQFDVVVKVSSKIANMIKRKYFLPKQKIKTLSDGSLIVTSTVSTYDAIDPEIKSWLPHIEVLEPEEYRVKFKNELTEYINDLR